MSEFKEKVDALVSQMTQGEDGKWVLPADVEEGLDEPTKYAVTAERRVRDTQSAFTKSRQELKKQEAVAAGLQERLLNSEVKLTPEQRLELSNLKKTDPEAWRTKLNEYETQARTSLETELNAIRTESANKTEVEIRKEQMQAWSESTGITLNDEVVQNDLPPRYIKDLESGKITFEEFLTKAGTFLKSEKVIQGAGESVEDDTLNLGKVAGGSEPSKNAQEGDFLETYEKNTLF